MHSDRKIKKSAARTWKNVMQEGCLQIRLRGEKNILHVTVVRHNGALVDFAFTEAEILEYWERLTSLFRPAFERHRKAMQK